MEAGGLDAERIAGRAALDIDYTLGGALGTWQWWALWLVLFLNTSAGISLISQEVPDLPRDREGQARSQPESWSEL